MFKNFSITSKISGLVFVIVVLTVLGVSYLSYKFGREALEDQHKENLRLVAFTRKDKIKSFFEQAKANIEVIEQSNAVKNVNSDVESQTGSIDTGFDGFDFSVGDDGDESAEFGESTDEIDVNDYLKSLQSIYGYDEIALVDFSKKYLASSNGQHEEGKTFIDPDEQVVIQNADRGFYISNVFQDDADAFYAYCGKPFRNTSGEALGVILAKIDLGPLISILQDTTALGKTGETLIASYEKKREDLEILTFLNLPRHSAGWEDKQIQIGESKAKPMQKAVKGESGSGYDTDYRGETVLATWDIVPVVNWGLVAKIDLAEISSESSKLIENFLLASIAVIVLAMLISLVFSQFLVRPIISLKSTLQLIGSGVLPDKVDKQSSDEIGSMANAADNLVQTLKRTASFAQRIGEGDFDANFKPISDNDTLGTALLNMRDNLIESEKKDKERNWIVTGLAEIGEILRANDSLEKLGDEVIKFIIGKVEAIQGAFYVIDDEDKDDIRIEMKASFAYNRKKYLDVIFKFAEGLVGQAVAEQDTIMRTEIPENYVTITSGLLGDQKPSCILIVPLITEEEVYGVLEFAGFNKFTPKQVKFVEELSVILARTVFNIKVNERTRKLLEESQTMSNELQEKQEVLRQNAEEMQATQEELRRSNTRLEEQIEEVNRTQKRMQLLLENASEVITIYEEDETIRYISPSVEPILGYTQKEMMGTKDINKVHEEYREAFDDMFKALIENPNERVTIQYEYFTKKGDTIWLESTGANFLSNPAIHGLIVNSRDITERRRAEREQRMRSKMQALSENSPDLITRLEVEGPISYINPVIETYFGNRPDHYINKKLEEVGLNEKVLEQYHDILQNVVESNGKVAMDMDFPSSMGDRIMQVDAIPEYDEETEKLESVLVVSHDITEMKLIEMEIKNKNKKIADSINYAKRIQGAILPNTHIINKTLPDSFILYKPKDVVSGDFPWYTQTAEGIYMAAVDCTGHGVPGALLSLIGYFLLNDIVKSRKITDPGVILDQLDEGVTQTLRQDQDDSKTKDGMDIALCKINPDGKTIEYAGAHRPLYVVKGGEMEEVKGNKFAIGGGIYKNQTNFTNTKVTLGKGDSLYFCSDGFPDQFGGPENRKFGPKRLRSLIMDVHNRPMTEAYQAFDDSWEDWKGDKKQTDDVLLIGIKF
ncbi:MAG: PAS domain S-box protein [Bacteroidota bacterium]